MNFKEHARLVTSGLLPAGAAEPVDSADVRFIKFSDYHGESLNGDKILILDDAVWYTPSNNKTYSGNEKGKVGLYTEKSNAFIFARVVDKSQDEVILKPYRMVGLTEKQDKYKLHLKHDTGSFSQSSKKERTNMTQPNQKPTANELLDSLANKAKEAQKAAPMTAVPNKGSLTETEKRQREAKKMENQANQTALDGRIKAMTERVTTSIADDAVLYTQKFARFVGVIAPSQPKITFGLSKYVDKADPATAANGHNTEYIVKIQESKPGKPKGVILKMPSETYRALDTFKDNSEKFEMSELSKQQNPTMVTVIHREEVAHTVIAAYCCGKIKEDEELWALAGHAGQSGVIECGYRPVNSKTKGTSQLRPFMKPKRESGITSLIVDWNYLPMKKYKTISIGQGVKVNPEDMTKLVDTIYYPMSQGAGTGADKDSATTKYDRLRPDCKKYIHVSGDGVDIDYLHPDKEAFDQLLSVKRFWASKNDTTNTISHNGVVDIAYKEWVKPKDASKAERLQYQTVSVLDPEGEEIFSEYATFVNYVGKEYLTPAKLKEFTRRSPSQKVSASVITGSQAQKMALGSLTGSLTEVGGVKVAVSSDMADEIAASIREARASLLDKVQ